MSSWMWTERGVVPLEQALVPAADRGLLLGEGVYETCDVMAGSPFALGRHLARLRRSASLVGLTVPWSDEVIRSACDQAVRAARDEIEAGPEPESGPAVGRLRITITGGPGPLGPATGEPMPTLLVAAGPSRPWGPVADVVTSPWRLNERSPLVGAKCTSYLEHLLWLADAHRRGADEAIMTNTSGALAEGSASNLFLLVDGDLCTPSLATGCLAGVTRELVTELVSVTERDDLTVDDLRRASEAFLTSSTRGVHPIARVDGVPLPEGPGPATHRADAALAALRACCIDP